MPNGDDLEQRIKDMSPWELRDYKQNLVSQMKGMSSQERSTILSRMQNIPGLRDISSGINVLFPAQERQPTQVQAPTSDIPLWQGKPYVGEGQAPLIQPIPQKESKLKDIWDAFYLGATQMGHQTKQYFLGVFPNTMFPEAPSTLFPEREPAGYLTPYQQKHQEAIDIANIRNRKIRTAFKKEYVKSEIEHLEWLKAHPELQPRPEWAGGTIDALRKNPKLLLDPAYWAFVAAENAAFVITFLGTTLAVTAVTGNPLVGLGAGVAVTNPAITQMLYEDLVDAGATDQQAAELAAPIGAVISSVEVVGAFPVLKAISSPFAKLWRREVSRQLARQTVKELTKKGLTTATQIEIAETLEEITQGVIQDATVKTFDENRNLLENIPETMIRTAIATLPLAVLGGAGRVRMERGQPTVPPTITPEVTKPPTPEVPITKPAVTTEMPTIPVTPRVAPAIPLTAPITPAQATQITELATAKALISELGKPKPQLRRLIKVYTDKIKIGDLNQSEADTLIEALDRLPDATYRKGVLIPPSIPTSAKVVTENFFNLKFKRPTPVRLLTSQTYYAQLLGVKPLVNPLELAKQREDLVRNALWRSAEVKFNEVKKLGKTSLIDRTATTIAKTPVARMGNLLDKYEDAPNFLSAKEAELFTWFRNLSRTIIKGENEVRRLLGMPEIPYRRAYVRHTSGLVDEILRGRYPLPEGLKYWSSQIVGKKIFNPMEMKRLATDLEEYLVKDLEYATKSMIYIGLREIHLSQPLQVFNEQLSALSKDLPIYKHLSAEERAALAKIDVMPASTKKWVIDYVNQVIRGQPTGLDEAVNRMLISRGLAGVFNTFLRPFGKSLGNMPITKLAVIQGRMIISGAMGWRPKQLIRNKFQWTQNLALYGLKANLKAILPATGTMKELMSESLFLKGYTGIEELPVDIRGKLERLWLGPYQWTAKTNAMDAMKAAFYGTEKLITNSKYKGLGWADPKRTYTEPKDFFYPSERAKLLQEMEFGAGCTQYQYIGLGMPEVFRHKVLTPLTRLQSWWMNYFFKFHREAATRAFTGQTSYGAKLPWSMRLNWFKYLILGGAILVPMGYGASYLWGVLPSRFAPAFQITVGTYRYAIADTEYEKKAALKQMFNAWQVMVPGGLAFKDFSAVFTGEKPIESLFFYSSKESVIYKSEWQTEWEAEGARRGRIAQIEDRVWAQYPSDYRTISDRIKGYEKTNPQKARQLQLKYPGILFARQQIALEKQRLQQQEKLKEAQERLRR